MKNQRCKGMQDLLDEDMLRFRRIEDVFRICCRDWGYREVRTPTLEYLHLFTTTGTLTPSMLNKVYSFLDWDGWSGERVVLRPDGTIPVARLYIDSLSGHGLAKLFYVTNIFAFEETGRENRERWQCGAEFFGGGKIAPDVEIVLLASEVIRKLGLKNVQLQLSHAGLVKALLKELKLSPGEEARTTGRILGGDWEVLTRETPADSEINRLMASLLELKGKSSRFLRNVSASFPNVSQDFKSSLDAFIDITSLLDDLDCSYEIDITAIHGFEYYTGTCFQFLVAGEKIGGGGRYDKLVPLMNGEDVPACGFALYIDTLMKLLPPEKEKRSECGILVQSRESTPETVRTCFALAESLRDSGYPVELDFAGREEPDYRWLVQISGKGASLFAVTDRLQNRPRYTGASTKEILKVLSEE
jgi:histidyl-tRNA synthetase